MTVSSPIAAKKKEDSGTRAITSVHAPLTCDLAKTTSKDGLSER